MKEKYDKINALASGNSSDWLDALAERRRHAKIKAAGYDQGSARGYWIGYEDAILWVMQRLEEEAV